MSIDHKKLKDTPRLLMEAVLTPLQGDRFQPTGFADLGPARYTLPDDNGTTMLLVESAQSVANRMELACCKDDRRTLLDELVGLPYVAGKHGNEILTTSYLEAHRLSSPYLLNREWARALSREMQLRDDYQISDKAVMKTLFKYDPCCLLHGVWLGVKDYKAEFSGGRVRITRSLSGFIEARDVVVAESGGTKFDKNAARVTETGNAETGYGTIPFHRTEFTARETKAYFNLDMALIRGYGLGEHATNLLIALALFKVRRFLSTGLRLRTACDLKAVGDLVVTRPEDFTIPSEKDLLAECVELIGACRAEGLFADPPVTPVTWAVAAQRVTIDLPIGTPEPAIPEDLKKRVKLKKATKKSGPKLELSEGLDEELAGTLKTLFPGNQLVADAIEDALKQSEEGKDMEDSETGTEGEK